MRRLLLIAPSLVTLLTGAAIHVADLDYTVVPALLFATGAAVVGTARPASARASLALPAFVGGALAMLVALPLGFIATLLLQAGGPITIGFEGGPESLPPAVRTATLASSLGLIGGVPCAAGALIGHEVKRWLRRARPEHA